MLYVCVMGVMNIFCLYCEAWSCRCSCMESVSVSSCRCCMFVSCVHTVAVHNAAFCMTCCLLMLVEHAIDDHMEEAYPPTLNISITFNNKIATTPKHIANCFPKQFTNTVKQATHKTDRSINRAKHKIQGYNITLTTTQVQEAIKQSKNNNQQCPDKLNIRHLIHIDPLDSHSSRAC